MDVLFLINSLGAGGAEHSLAEMLPLFERAGVRPTIACFQRSDEGVHRAVEAGGLKPIMLEGTSWASRVRAVRSLVKDRRPDLVHTALFEADVVGRVSAARTPAPVLTSLVNTTYDPVRLQDPNVRRWRLRTVRTMDGVTARWLTTHFHALTHAVKDASVRDLGIRPERITVVPRGRDPRRLGSPGGDRRRAARGDLGLVDEDLVVTTVGRQEFQKGQRYLIGAMDRLVVGRPHVRLLVAGRRGNASEDLDRLLGAARLDGAVRMLGHRTDAPEILAATDVFVFPSLYEGLGGALIEAMALGLPIVASDLPAIREVVEEGANAVLVPPAATAELAAAIGDLLDDPERRHAMGARSREIFLERFTLERSAAQMVALFERVATAGR